MKNKREELRNVINARCAASAASGMAFSEGVITNKDYSSDLTKNIDAIMDAVDAYVREVITENEKIPGLPFSAEAQRARIRNEFRVEQRQRAGLREGEA